MALFNFVNRVSSAGSLREALDQSAVRHRQIADRVANATMQNADGYAVAAAQAGRAASGADRGPVDTEQEMAALANEQLYFETVATRLKSTYDGIRKAISER